MPGIRIVTYEDLAKIDRITDLLKRKKDALILLFESEPNVGHWIAIMRENNKIIFFDPYGYRPDRFLVYTPQNLRKQLNQDTPHLTVLLNQAVDDGFKVVFNEYEFQNRRNLAYATCGRWIVSVIQYFQARKKPTLKGFHKLVMRLCKLYDLVPDLMISKIIQ